MDREKLLEFLKISQGFASKEIERAFTEIDRKDFVPLELQNFAYTDQALPIGAGASISQPSTVLFMVNQLDLRPNQKVLDLGSGSGWTTALLANALSPQGRVLGVEIIPELVNSGRKNVRKSGLKNWQIFTAGPQLGLPKEAPFHRILVSAAAGSLPSELLTQLANWGVAVLPIGNSVVKVARSEDKIIREDFPGFAFVPLA